MTTPTETDILRFCVALCAARDDEDEVRQVIEQHLANIDPYLHTTYLKVSLRVVVAQFFAPPARRLDHELGVDFVDAGLRLQAMANEGLDDQAADDPDRGPHLKLVADDEFDVGLRKLLKGS
ncbi:hypothetical protein FHR32_005113 [Streptosporangium album]|uniref:Uncharacterized protein n=1 Tax=Streptosporangium album TaxID=47479 RepID=A0A7W7S0K7_9ACTN|nr:hypothetical protein [Streptosporangium album]MBB4940736.1 hypothetical protein [Streptosporangium album]